MVSDPISPDKPKGPLTMLKDLRTLLANAVNLNPDGSPAWTPESVTTLNFGVQQMARICSETQESGPMLQLMYFDTAAKTRIGLINGHRSLHLCWQLLVEGGFDPSFAPLRNEGDPDIRESLPRWSPELITTAAPLVDVTLRLTQPNRTTPALLEIVNPNPDMSGFLMGGPNLQALAGALAARGFDVPLAVTGD